jgi:hypothetical protein
MIDVSQMKRGMHLETATLFKRNSSYKRNLYVGSTFSKIYFTVNRRLYVLDGDVGLDILHIDVGSQDGT